MPESDSQIAIGGQPSKTRLELSFEYLMAKDTLKWITIRTDQVHLTYLHPHEMYQYMYSCIYIFLSHTVVSLFYVST